MKVCRDDMGTCQIAICEAMVAPPPEGLDVKHVVSACGPSSSVVIRKHKPDGVHPVHLELFAGGFAGWHRAQGLMQNEQLHWHATLTIEQSADACAMFAKSHVCSMVEPSDLWAPDLPANEMCDRGACVLFHGSVQDPVWLRLMPVEHECIASISAPCGPWSRGGRTRGFDSPHGRVFLQAIKQMRRAAPRAIATENVDRFLQHPERRAIYSAMAWAGYELLWEAITDVRDVSPSNRKRWLSAWVPTGCSSSSQGAPALVPIHVQSMMQFHTFPPLPFDHEKALTLTADLLSVYGDPHNLSVTKTPAMLAMSQDEVIAKRTRSKCGVWGTHTASYSAQHFLSEGALENKGIFAELVQGNFGVRFLSPVEASILHCVVGFTCRQMSGKPITLLETALRCLRLHLHCHPPTKQPTPPVRWIQRATLRS